MSGRLLVVLAAALAASGCGAARPQAASKKVIVLGIDGMDPAFLERHWSALPNLDRLRRQGDFKRLGTTTPPQSPVAWSTFITGRDPAGHGIFDFVHRDPATLRPFSSMGETLESRRTLPIGPYALPLSRGEVVSFRKGTAFWQLLSSRGVPATVLRMPTNYPADPLPVRGTGRHGHARSRKAPTAPSPSSPATPPTPRARFQAAASCAWTSPEATCSCPSKAPSTRCARTAAAPRPPSSPTPTAPAARFDLDGARVILRPGEWSDWLRVRFPLIPGLASATGILRIYLKQLSPHLEVYVSPVNIDPAAPDVPISVPASYSRDLARAHRPLLHAGHRRGHRRPAQRRLHAEGLPCAEPHRRR